MARVKKPRISETIEDAVVVSSEPPVNNSYITPPEPILHQLVIHGVTLGTYLTYEQKTDTTIVFNQFESSIGLPSGNIGYDAINGYFMYWDVEGNVTLTLSVVKMLHQILYPATNDNPTANNTPVETISAAAIQSNGVTYSLPRPARHGHIIASLHGTLDAGVLAHATQGFTASSDGRFLNKVMALEVAQAAGQLINRDGADLELSTENLW